MRRHVPLLLLAALATTACASTTGSCPDLLRPPKHPVRCAAPPSCLYPPYQAEFPFHNLVLQGGGVKGIAYAGAFEQLQEQKIPPQIERVDGGVLLNYPIDTFDKTGINPDTLGLSLSNGPPPRVDVDDLPRYGRQLFATLLDTQVVDLQTNPADLERTVLINDLGIPTTDFELTDQQKCALIAQGYECTCRYLSDWKPAGTTPISNLGPLGRATRIETAGKCGAAWSLPPPPPKP